MRESSFRRTVAQFVREKVVRRILPDSVSGNLNRNDRTGALYRAWGHVFTSHIEGAYYEFGVYRGAAFRASVQAYKIFSDWQQDQLVSEEPWRQDWARQYVQYKHHFYAFDTFQGMPGNQEGNLNFAEGNLSCSLEEFRRLNRQAGIVENPRIRYFVGTFRETAQRDTRLLRDLQPAAIVNLDCDLYQSAREALDLIAPKLAQGTVLLVDDWNTFAARRDQGERRALKEFVLEHPQLSLEPWFPYEFAGQSFLVHVADEKPVVSSSSLGERNLL